MKRCEAISARTLFQIRSLGWAGAAGALLIVAALAVDAWQAAAAEARIAAANRQYAALRARPATAPGMVAPEERLAAFHDRLRPPEDGRSVPEIVHAAAHARGVRLARGDYRVSRESGGRILRYQITLPAQGRYPQLRAWLADIMNALPGAGVEGLTLRREGVGQPDIEAQVRLVVYLKAS